MPERVFRQATAEDAGRVTELLTDSWGETRAVGHGVVHDLTALPTLLAESDGELVGVLMYEPSIPEIGAYGTEIRDELDLELPLSGGGGP